MNKAALLEHEAQNRILLTDGAFGTQLAALQLSASDYQGALTLSTSQQGNYDLLSITRPDVIVEVASAYLRAGADIISTNTFNANRISQSRFGTEHLVEGMNVAAASLARGMADRATAQNDRPHFVAGVVGPISLGFSHAADMVDVADRMIGAEALKCAYAEQVHALLEGGVDFILVETVLDTRTAEAAIAAIEEVGRGFGRKIPVMLSMTMDDRLGRNLSGHDVEAFWRTVRHANPLTIGINCACRSSQAYRHLSSLAEVADCLTMVYPDVRSPGHCDLRETPQTIAARVGAWAEAGLVNVLGSCCGSTPAHIAAIRAAVDGVPPRARAAPSRNIVQAISIH